MTLGALLATLFNDFLNGNGVPLRHIRLQLRKRLRVLLTRCKPRYLRFKNSDVCRANFLGSLENLIGITVGLEGNEELSVVLKELRCLLPIIIHTPSHRSILLAASPTLSFLSPVRIWTIKQQF